MTEAITEILRGRGAEGIGRQDIGSLLQPQSPDVIRQLAEEMEKRGLSLKPEDAGYMFGGGLGSLKGINPLGPQGSAYADVLRSALSREVPFKKVPEVTPELLEDAVGIVSRFTKEPTLQKKLGSILADIERYETGMRRGEYRNLLSDQKIERIPGLQNEIADIAKETGHAPQFLKKILSDASYKLTDVRRKESVGLINEFLKQSSSTLGKRPSFKELMEILPGSTKDELMLAVRGGDKKALLKEMQEKIQKGMTPERLRQILER